MRILYIANVRMPTEKAHGVQIMKMCEAFTKSGAEVFLIVPFRFNKIKKDPFIFYNIEKKFGIKKIFSLDLMPLDKIFGAISFYAQVYTFGIGLFLKKKSIKADYIYCRDGALLPFVLKLGPPVIYEAHNLSDRNIVKQKSYWQKCHRIITITCGLKKIFTENGVGAEKILVAPDGVDLERFNIDVSKENCREKLGLPKDKKIILYAGHLYAWKGANTLLDAAKNFNSLFSEQKDFIFLFVGGTAVDIANFRNKAKGEENIKILGHEPYKDMPYYLKAADVLILPNSGREAISRLYTSPMKLFEYMASGNPIIVSDLPSLREILTEEDAIFFKPDDARDLAEKIKSCFESYEAAKNLSACALNKVLLYTWQNRARNIRTYLKNSFVSEIEKILSENC